MKKLSILLLFAGTFLVTACNTSTTDDETGADSLATPESSSMTTNNPLVEDDANEFAKEAAMGGLMEVEFGKIAAQKATDPEVKAFAQKMVDEHSKANEELKAIAASKNIVLPATLDDEHQKKLNDLNEKTGDDFDKEYVDMMVDDHKKDVEKFEKAAEQLKDAELKNFAASTLPKLQEHLATIQRIDDNQ